jgi:hypothetical protein
MFNIHALFGSLLHILTQMVGFPIMQIVGFDA